jgi:methyl halide transferase
MPGPPWGVQPETYLALLTRPGTEIVYDDSGKVVLDEHISPWEGGLKRLALIKPRRTHQSGYEDDGQITDNISVWSH